MLQGKIDCWGAEITRAPCRNHMASYGVDVSIVSNFRTCRCETKEEISMRNQKIYEWERTLCSIWGAVNRIAAYARRSRGGGLSAPLASWLPAMASRFQGGGRTCQNSERQTPEGARWRAARRSRREWGRARSTDGLSATSDGVAT